MDPISVSFEYFLLLILREQLIVLNYTNVYLSTLHSKGKNLVRSLCKIIHTYVLKAMYLHCQPLNRSFRTGAEMQHELEKACSAPSFSFAEKELAISPQRMMRMVLPSLSLRETAGYLLSVNNCLAAERKHGLVSFVWVQRLVSWIAGFLQNDNVQEQAQKPKM